MVKDRLHSAADASPPAALLLPQILPGILGRRALPAGRLRALDATPVFHHGLLDGEAPAVGEQALQQFPRRRARELAHVTIEVRLIVVAGGDREVRENRQSGRHESHGRRVQIAACGRRPSARRRFRA